MNRFKIYFIVVMIFFRNASLAQTAKFVTAGQIEYEKTINMYALIKKDINKDNTAYMSQIFEAYKASNPQFKKLYSTLTFNNNVSLFAPVEQNIGADLIYDNVLSKQNNIVYCDFKLKKFISQRNFFDKTFLLKDTSRKIKWKITDEVREIAGYLCTRANGIVLDSIYVVAFYTDQIPVPGGPEMFNGLPGMILGVALPHENVTWFATKVVENKFSLTNKKLLPPNKGIAINEAEFREIISKALKNHDLSYANDAIKGFLL